MAGNNEIPRNGYDKVENFKPEEGNKGAEEAFREQFRQIASARDVAQTGERMDGKFDPKEVSTAMQGFHASMERIGKYFQPDASGTSFMERLAKYDADMHKGVVSHTAELRDKAHQTHADIQELMKKLTV